MQVSVNDSALVKLIVHDSGTRGDVPGAVILSKEKVYEHGKIQSRGRCLCDEHVAGCCNITCVGNLHKLRSGVRYKRDVSNGCCVC
jgi:hypothetical protein